MAKDEAKTPPKTDKKPTRTYPVMGSKNPRNKEAMEAAGMKNGGMIKSGKKGKRGC